MSHQTVDRRTAETGKSIERNLESKSANLKPFALAIDKSTDATDMAQLAVFIIGIDGEYNVTEWLAPLVPLKDTIPSHNLFEAVNKTKQNKTIFFNLCQHI